MEDPILEIKIEMIGSGFRMKTELGEVSMIPFEGKVESEMFSGIVEPWGVDTQIVNQMNIRHLSARYVLTGKDRSGSECHIYVENNSWQKADELSLTFKSVPTFYTDSPLLAPYLHRNQFIGTGTVQEDGLWIRFYEIEHQM